MTYKKTGKKVDTFVFQFDGMNVESPVHLKIEKSSAGTSGESRFHVYNEEYEMHLHDTDIEKLRVAAREFLHQRVSVKWEPFIKITVSGRPVDSRSLNQLRNPVNDRLSIEYDFEGIFGRIKSELEIEVEALKIGTKPNGGKMYRNANSSTLYRHTSEGEPVTGNSNNFGTPSTIAIVPDTRENRAAIADLIDRMSQVRNRLGEMMMPDQIRTTLALMQGGNPFALPAFEGQRIDE